MHPFIAQLKDLVSHNRTAVVLDLLPHIFRQKEEAFTAATLLRGRYSQTREDQLGNLITEEAASVEYTRINNAVLELLEDTDGLVFDTAAAQKLMNELLADDEKWRVREGFLDRIRQSQAENMARHNKDDALISHRVNSKVAVWIVLPIFLLFAIAFLILAIKAPPAPVKQNTSPTREVRKPNSTEQPVAPLPKKAVPPPLRKQ